MQNVFFCTACKYKNSNVIEKGNLTAINKKKTYFLGEDDMDETGGQISNVNQQVDGSSDAEESQRLVSYTFCS